MVRRSLTSFLASVALSLLMILALAVPAQAVTLEQKLAALAGFSQPTTSSFNTWHAAWQNQSAWAEYNFDWSTDLCSNSPDQPLGFDFRMPCRRHDFGYRSYKAVGQFPSNKPRIDDAFYADMLRVCSAHSGVSRATCEGLAWTYYQAVKNFGNLVVTDKQIQQVAEHSAVRT